MTEALPLILTAQFDPATFARLDAMRRAHFPAARNLLPAHLTLFHHLPGAHPVDVVAAAQQACRREAFALHFPRPRFLGRGVALDVHAPPLLDVREAIATRFRHDLTRQDQQGFRPHVTIQNKVDPKEARRLFDMLTRDFDPWSGTITGLLVWRYENGPWSLVDVVPFG